MRPRKVQPRAVPVRRSRVPREERLRRAGPFLYYSCAALLVARVVLRSWIEEDAFITFRVVDNFVHGYGLRWNVFERVQSYTNPLWMLLHIPVYAVTGSIVHTTLALCWGCLLAVLFAVRKTFDFSLVRHATLFVVPLLVSATHNLFFSSGLETPLLNLLFVCFGYVLLRRPRRYWFWLSLLTSLSAWTRLDTVLVYVPFWVWALLSQLRTPTPGTSRRPLQSTLLEIISGTVPLLCWLLFSLFYYGFLLPNTAPAKLAAGLPQWDYVRSGLAYTLDFLLADPWSAALIFAASVYFPVVAWRSRGRGAAEDACAAALAVGAFLYVVYAAWIGGYQLSLRMSTLPALAACWLWLWRFPFRSDRACLVAGALALNVNMILGMSPDARYRVPFIQQQKISGKPMARFLFVRRGPSWTSVGLDQETLKARPAAWGEPKYVVQRAIGMYGFYNGPSCRIVDPCGLSDPLLARLPSRNEHLQRVGHIERDIPSGYLQAVATGSPASMVSPLSEYYSKLQLITQGSLWDPRRLGSILRFNLGQYDSLRKQYLRQAQRSPSPE